MVFYGLVNLDADLAHKVRDIASRHSTHGTRRMLLASYPGTSLRYSYEARCDSYRYRINALKSRMARGRTPA